MCSHAAALFNYGIYKLSRTDVECSWKKWNAPDISRKCIAEMFPPTKPGYTTLLWQQNQGDREALYSERRAYGKFTGLYWLLSPEPRQLGDLPVSTVEELIFFRSISHSIYCCWTTRVYQTKIKGWERNCKSSQPLTVGQRNNPSWHLVWKGCLTANNSGTVINAKRVTLSLIKRLGGIWHFTGQRCGKVKKMKKRGLWKFLSIVLSILQFQKISIPTTRVVFGLFGREAKLEIPGWGNRVAGSNQRTILREVWISFWNHTMWHKTKMFSN